MAALRSRCRHYICVPFLSSSSSSSLAFIALTVLVGWQEGHPACKTRRPASSDRSARRQFQATGQPVSWMQASDAMTSLLPSYEAKCVQHMMVLPMRVGPFAFKYQGNGATPCQYLDTTQKAIDCATTLPREFLCNETLQQTFRPVLSKLPNSPQI